MNVIIPDNLSGKTTIRLRNVTWRQFLDVVLSPLNYTYVEDQNIIRITSIRNLITKPFDTRIFLVNYADAGELEKSISPRIDTANGGSLQVDTRSNALVITERPSRMTRIQEIITRLDRMTSQVMIEVKLFEITKCEQANIGADIVKQPTDSSKTTMAAETINSDADAKNVASESLISSIPVPHYTYNDNQEKLKFDRVEYQNIDMKVRPEVNSAGFIRLSIQPKVSSQTGEVDFNGKTDGREPLPVFTTRSISSKVMVKDGYTLSIGSMSQQNNHFIVAPDLSEAPELRRLLKSKSEGSSTRKLVLFVTAKTLNPDGVSYQDTVDPRVLNEMRIIDSDIPGYHVPEKQFKLLNEIRHLRNEAARIEAELDYESSILDQLKKNKYSRLNQLTSSPPSLINIGMSALTIQTIGTRTSKWGEGPIWWNDQLIYVDIENHALVTLNPESGEEQTWNVGERIGTVVPRASGGTLYAGDTGIIAFDPVSGAKQTLADPESEKRATNRFNDGKCDPAGRFWAGTISLVKNTGDANLYMLDTDGSLQLKIDNVTNSNGICWNADATKMYYIDTATKQVRAYDYDNASGAISNATITIDTAKHGYDSSPDGMTIDANGNLWVAFCHGGCVTCFDPNTGKEIRKVELPCLETTACAFGGPNLDRLFITTGIHSKIEEADAGKVFVIDGLGVKGVPAFAYNS